MILTVSKAWADIKFAIDHFQLKKVVIIGCGDCSAVCQTGGTIGVKKIADRLMADKINVIASIVIETPCDVRLLKQELKRIQEEFENADGFIVASCGIGAQTVGEVTTKPVIITTNTIMSAQTERIGIYHEKCRSCGVCWLNETGGICPITACPKEMLNGPCGASFNGKCEVGNYTRPCGWIQIFERLKHQGNLNFFQKVRPPRDWAQYEKRRDTNQVNEMKNYYAD